MRVGIVCEGSTDRVVLEAVATEVLRDQQPTFSLLQPDFDRLRRPHDARKPATGWQAVRSFLKAGNVQVTPLDLVIVQIDASVRHLDEVARLLDDEEIDTLCDHVKEWIGRPVPDAALITLPREEIETWLVAANTRRKDVESFEDPVAILVDAGLLDARKSRPVKESRAYEMLVPPLRRLLGDRKRLRAVPELERFCTKLRAHAGRRR